MIDWLIYAALCRRHWVHAREYIMCRANITSDLIPIDMFDNKEQVFATRNLCIPSLYAHIQRAHIVHGLISRYA